VIDFIFWLLFSWLHISAIWKVVRRDAVAPAGR